ncbi:MAG: F0F1 ATP synthase subunit B [Parvularculaceae bacterium]
MGIEFDATFWAFVALLIFFGLVYYIGAPAKIAAALDKRSKAIADELEEARRLREEAQELLAKYQRKQKEAAKEADDIIALAKENAERLIEETREKLAEQLERRTRQAEDKIARAEHQAAAEVRNASVDVAVAAARTMIAEGVDANGQSALIDQMIDAIAAGASPQLAQDRAAQKEPA